MTLWRGVKEWAAAHTSKYTEIYSLFGDVTGMRSVAAALSTAARTPLQGAGADASYTGDSEEGVGGEGGELHRDVTTHSAARMYIGEHTLRARTRIAQTKPHAPPQN